MNKAKLIALCAKVMGWHAGNAVAYIVIGPNDSDTEPVWLDDNDCIAALVKDYNPLDNADQADELLEYVAFNLGCSWSCGYNILASEYWCQIPTVKGIFIENRRTQNFAKILCALRASDKVTDAEINDATTALAVTVESE